MFSRLEKYPFKAPDTNNSSTGRFGLFSFSPKTKDLYQFLTGVVVFLVFGAMSGVYGQPSNNVLMAAPVLTDLAQIWSVPHDRVNEEFRIKTEIVVYFDDTEWGNASGECEGTPRWLPIFDSSFPFKSGERVAIDGVVVPASERFVWSKTKIHVLAENVPLVAQTVTNLEKNPQDLADHLVSVEGLVDNVLDEKTHCSLGFLSGSTMAHAYILKGTNYFLKGDKYLPAPFKPGDIVRIKGVYSPEYDRDGKLSSLSLWASSPDDVQIIGSLEKDARFNLPVTSCRDLQTGLSGDALVHVAGIVHKYEAGKWVTIWDGTGQVMIQSKQTQPLRFGDPIEAVGYPYYVGVQQCLHDGLFRVPAPAEVAAISQANATNALPLCLAEEVRDMSLEEAAKHLPVSLRGIVTWSHKDTTFVYVLDDSGGVKVQNPTWDNPGTRKPGTIVTLTGVTDAGSFVPVVTNAMMRRAGWFNIDGPKPVTLEQALTGVEEGNWVEMQGFVRKIKYTRGLTRFDLSTSSGDFRAYAPASQPFDWVKGSIISLDGVCSAFANKRHQLTGIQLWVPDTKYIEVEDPAPDDLFSAPLRPLATLRRFNMESTLNQRVHTSGIVVLDEPSNRLCIQDGVDSLEALSMQTNAVQPGDRVEVVGFPGEQGQKFVFREAEYRSISRGPEPMPIPLSYSNSTDPNLDGLLVKAEGTLLNKLQKNGETRLLVQAKSFIFEASLNSSAGNENLDLPLASRIAVTGVYEMQNDEYGQPRSFLLYLRSGNDVQLLKQAPWWTPERLWWGLTGTVIVFLVAVFWGILIARKNAVLYHTQAQLQVANDQLETRVAERTQELQDQVKARELANTELARAQHDLVLASRQAGMAEVATGVLHNVGNVLNSVNVSATLLRDQARRSKTNSLLKVTTMLKEQNGDLGTYLASDPKGKLVPKFFVEVADELKKEQESALSELAQLSKNVDHIKDIVAMQQSYARVAGVVEKITLPSLVDDALQINATPLSRNDVVVIKQFADVPVLTVDKHKVLQILINLVRNAIYALEECTQSEKKLTFDIAKAGEDSVRVQVQDNGVGIPAENLTRIFSHGFTTRESGHGFGLHIGALNAKEMGGSLSAASDGAGKGATFTLILPFSPPK
jgi:signal transduction histidine kinase